MTFVVHYIVPAIHVLACFFLIVVVLLQTGKGADMGAVFGGGSQTLFGSSGAGNFLTKLTTGTAIAFMITSLVLTWGASRTPGASLLNRLPAAEAPASPAAQPPPAEVPAEPGAQAEPPAQAPTAAAEGEPTPPPAADAPAGEQAPAQ
jgi:preprotein translocase subunit SecG